MDLNRANNNLIEMSGEAALVVAARGGQLSVLRQLLTSPHSPPSVSQQSAALYAASRTGQLEIVKYLVNFGVNIDVGVPEPPLIGALHGGHSEVGLFLMQNGVDCDIKDSRGNSCLHIACSLGLYEVVRSLCILGCVQGPNARGQYPLHIAARNGHLQVVRLLCFYGCKLDQKNGDGIRADITALKYGHNDIAELLDKLRACGYSTSSLRSQLLPGNRPLARPQVKLFGHSGVGKSSFATSLKAGLLHALFRRSTSLTTRSRPSSPCQSSQIEMDVTPRQNSLSFDTCNISNYIPTNGVQAYQMDLSGVGDITVWDFSGQESFFHIFHYFLTDIYIPAPSSLYASHCSRTPSKRLNSNELAKYTAANDNVITNIGKTQNDFSLDCLTYKNHENYNNFNDNKYASIFVYVIMFSLEKPYNIQLQQCCYWLNFIISKLSPCVVEGGLGNVILIGTHADLKAYKTPQGDYLYPAGESLLQSIQDSYSSYFQIHNQVLALDCNASTSIGLRTFKSYLASIKRSFMQVSIGYWNGFLEGALSWIINIRKNMDSFPVMTKDAFMTNIRCNVNQLASDEHIMDIIHHLHVIGEILVFGNLIVLCCDWMGQILGTLFGKDGLHGARILGVYTAHDFQAHFGYCDATQLLELLQALRLCTMCEVDDEIEYEFPCFNLVETLEGLWDSQDARYKASSSCFGGVKLCQFSGFTHLIVTIFPHIQVELRDHIENLKLSDQENEDYDLYQWWHGSKLCLGPVECLLTLNGSHGAEYLHLRIRGPPGQSQICFLVQQKVLQWIYKAFVRVAPGLVLETFILSSNQLRLYCDEPYAWSSLQINQELFQKRDDDDSPLSLLLFNPITGKRESLQSLICFDNPSINDNVEWFPKINVKKISNHLMTKLGSLLDPPHPLGTHWCMLAVALGINQDRIAAFDSETDIWHTSKLLKTVHCDMGTLIQKLNQLNRSDAVNAIYSLSPIFLLVEYEKAEVVKPEEEKSTRGLSVIKENNVMNRFTGSKIHTDV